MFIPHRSSWKFNKMSQIELIKHCCDCFYFGKEDFSILLEYLPSIKGDKQRLLAQEVCEKVKEGRSEGKKSREYKRAKKVLKILGEVNEGCLYSFVLLPIVFIRDTSH